MLFGLGVGLIAVFFAGPRSPGGTYRKLFPAEFAATTLTVVDEGLSTRSERGEGVQYWKGIQRLIETSDYFFLMLGQYKGYVVPKRCFSTLEAAAIFGNQVRLQLEKHAAPEGTLAGAMPADFRISPFAPCVRRC